MLSNVFHRRLDYQYPIITKAKGIYLYDNNGNRYIDAASGAGVTSIGHGDELVAEKINKLALSHTYLHGAQFTTEVMEKYAYDLCELSGNKYTNVMFFGSGSEGNESAIKLARQYHVENGNANKYRVISRYPSYHGSTVGMLSITGKQDVRKLYKPYLYENNYISTPYYYRANEEITEDEYAIKIADELQVLIDTVGAESISAFIFEPVVGASMGCVVPSNKYYKKINKICVENDILLISDEVMSGFGRCGEWFSSDLFDITPDIVVTGKGISGGYTPLSALFCSSRIYNTIQNGTGIFSHGFTYENTPFSCGIGGIVLEKMKIDNCVLNSKIQGDYLINKLKDEIYQYDCVGDIRGKGLFVGVEFVEDKKTKKTYPRNKRFAENFVSKGLFELGNERVNLYYSKSFTKNGGDAIMIMPPLNINRDAIDDIVDKFKNIINNIV